MHLLHVPATWVGYGRYGIKLSEALTRAGIDNINTLERSDIRNVVAWVSTPAQADGWFDGQYKVLSTMWEAQSLPEAFRENLHEFDQIVVPSEHNVELFGRWHQNVTKVPLGVDTSEWNYRPRQPHDERFNFLIGGSGPRKGTDLAYRAFRKLYGKTWPTDGPMPWLIMKSPRSEDFYGDRIERIGGRVSDADERDIYGMAHCYLQPSRGEGWGLQPLQAIAQGIPTILTNAHGHAEFAHLGYPISAGNSKAAYFTSGDAGEWWEPRFDELCQAMEWVYEHYDEAAAKARDSARVVEQMFSWDATAERFTDAIGRYRLEVPYTGNGQWTKPFARHFLVRVDRPWQCHIGHIDYRFERGRDYFEPAEVKRILFEAGVLDPACLNVVDNGLNKEQLDKIPEYSASHARCPTCGQRFNTDQEGVIVS
jgi:hypothetical protein